MLQLRKFVDSDLELVLQWRNSPNVRKNMYNDHIISESEHEAWYNKIKVDESKKYLICVENEVALGLVSFYDISKIHKTAFWAFYSGNLERRGIGSVMEYLALNYAFDQLGLEKLSCEVLSFNSAVIKLHRKFGFSIEGRFKRHFFRAGEFHDIYRLAIFKRDWIGEQRSEMEQKLFRNDNALTVDDQLKVGSKFSSEFTLSQSQINQFADLTGDKNQVHLDSDFAKGLGFPDRIAHGFLVGSVFSKVLGTHFPGAGTIYKDQTLSFKRPVLADQRLQCQLKVISKVGKRVTLETLVLDEQNQVVIEGEALVIAPQNCN